MDFVRKLLALSSRGTDVNNSSTTSNVLVISTTALATAGLIAFARVTLWPSKVKVLDNPLKNVIPHMSKEKLKELVYQPDAFPGARDVDTPYGSIRAYEFGPEDGEKVLLVHGISTSCITLGQIARSLADSGHRVMLFDLFGRGFTDGVGDLPHDDRLYISQILLVLASSPLAWTGHNAFSMIGYSMGGGIAVNFSRYYPNTLRSLILLAPSGLIRPESIGAGARLAFSSGIVPERLLTFFASRRLQQPIASSRAKKIPASDPRVAIAAAEIADPANKTGTLRVEQHVLKYVRWMVINHLGFVPAFMSCVQYAPLMEQHESWRHLARRKPGSSAVFFAASDEIIDHLDYERNGLPLAGGKDNLHWRVLPGAHDFVMTHSQEVIQAVNDFWDKPR